MNRKMLMAGGVLVVIVAIYFTIGRSKVAGSAELISSVKVGPFRVEIETTGELEAKNSVKILGPAQLRNFQIWNVTLQKIVDEGTVVKKGDWVASLDPSEFQRKFGEKQIELEKANSRFMQIKLDTTLQMRQTTDELVNLKYAVDEKRIVLEQSKFEPPATVKQNEINMEKAQRAYQQALENLKIKRRQSIEKMREVSAELRKVKNDFEAMQQVMAAFSVTAPEDGMVIYAKGEWDNKPIKAGSQIHMWNPTVATLPDMTIMLSKTFVNEVDVRKVKMGQTVEIGLDAFPEKKLAGKVVKVANVGEQRPNSDSKVFEVSVEILGTDALLRPSMTTSNKIITQVLDSVMSIPLECLQAQADTITYVFLKKGSSISKQEVVIGETNANEAVVLEGLSLEDKVFLSFPSGMEDKEVRLLDSMNGKRRKDEGNDKEKQGVIAKPVSLP